MDSQPTANFVAGQLVACGGDSCDRYEDGSWRHMVYTISRRRQHSSAQSENRILLIGGFDDSSRSTTEWISLKVGVFVMTFLNIDNMIECWSARNLRNRFTMVTESKTLPKAQRTRGLSSAYQSNFFRSYHKFLHKSSKSRPSTNFKISTKHQHLNKTYKS